MQQRNSKKPVALLAVLAIVMFGVIYLGISFTQDRGKDQRVISTENATEKLDSLYKKVAVETVEARKEPVMLEETALEDTLPDIDKSPVTVENTTDDYIEIFASPEKAGSDKDGWLNEVAEDFNHAGIQVNGSTVSVKVRNVASGLGKDYILSGKYVPDAYTPSNELWGDMISDQGGKVTLFKERLVGNVAGIVLSKSKNDELTKKYGAINLKTITDAVANNEIAMGYTNPFASSTGLNFLLSTLSTFDSQNPFSETAISGFEKFQENIPFVAYTTIQMRESAKTGALDGFIMEYQTYINDAELKGDYVFTPFGIRHDSPIYAIGDLSAEKQAILREFVQFATSETYAAKAVEYGFNGLDEYKSEMKSVDKQQITKAQKLWKEKKNGTKKISAVFVADISGSMDGEPLNNLKKSLITGAEYIGKDNSIGLVTYSDDVNINLPVGKFDLNQRSLFTGAVMDLEASGGTATFDGMIVALKMLMEEKAANPDAKLMLFVLSDGETNRGHSLNDIEGILRTLKIPVYTIGYNANISALNNISSINEAASINAESDDVIYKLASLFNAQM